MGRAGRDKQFFSINQWMFILLLLLLCLLCTGCSVKEQQEAAKERPEVYIVYDSSRTTNDWDYLYGAIDETGRMVLPLERRNVEVIYDREKGQQLWLRTITVTVDDPSLTAEELYEEENYKHIHYQYQLYDLDGTFLQDLGQRLVVAVYGDYVLYNDGRLESRKTGEVLLEDVGYMMQNGDYYILYDYLDNSCRIADGTMRVLRKYENCRTLGNGWIVFRQDEKEGVCAADGTEVVPCSYDEILWCNAAGVDLCIAQKNGQFFVISLEDGAMRYVSAVQDGAQEMEIVYADDDVMLMDFSKYQQGEWQQAMQMYDYAGQPLSARYENIYREYGDDTGCYFMAATTLREPVLLNKEGQVVFEGAPDTWLQIAGNGRLIYSDWKDNKAQLLDLEGNVYGSRDYESMYSPYVYNDSLGTEDEPPLVIGHYRYGGSELCDLLDLNGGILIEKAKNITVLSEEHFWVEKGFSQGLMDTQGNWLFQQSLFDSAVDE